MVLDALLLNTKYHKVHIKGKGSNSGKGVASSPTSQCRRKGSLWVTLNYGQPT